MFTSTARPRVMGAMTRWLASSIEPRIVGAKSEALGLWGTLGLSGTVVIGSVPGENRIPRTMRPMCVRMLNTASAMVRDPCTTRAIRAPSCIALVHRR